MHWKVGKVKITQARKAEARTAVMGITAAVKAVPVKQIGYSGLMVPVMEDKVMAQRWAEGTTWRATACSPS